MAGSTQFMRGSATQNPPRLRAAYTVTGSHGGGDLTVPITKTRALTYTSGVTDQNPDISSIYRKFAIQTTAATAVDVEVQVSVNGSSWVAAPSSMCSTGSHVVTPGGLLFVESPMAGVRVRLNVVAPGAPTDFTITVLASDPVQVSDVGRL